MICFKGCDKIITELEKVNKSLEESNASFQELYGKQLTSNIDATCKWKIERDSLQRKIDELVKALDSKNVCCKEENVPEIKEERKKSWPTKRQGKPFVFPRDADGKRVD